MSKEMLLTTKNTTK